MSQPHYNEADAGLVQPVAQENGGTTYFYTQNAIQQNMSIVRFCSLSCLIYLTVKQLGH